MKQVLNLSLLKQHKIRNNDKINIKANVQMSNVLFRTMNMLFLDLFRTLKINFENRAVFDKSIKSSNLTGNIVA